MFRSYQQGDGLGVLTNGTKGVLLWYSVAGPMAGAARNAALRNAATNPGAPGSYAPNRALPRTKHGDPIPDVDAPHTQLGTRTDGTGSYNQARQWEVDPSTGRLQPTRDIDFTDHGYPATHPTPHQHPLTPNNPATVPGGGVQRGQPEPMVPGWLRWPNGQ